MPTFGRIHHVDVILVEEDIKLEAIIATFCVNAGFHEVVAVILLRIRRQNQVAHVALREPRFIRMVCLPATALLLSATALLLHGFLP